MVMSTRVPKLGPSKASSQSHPLTKSSTVPARRTYLHIYLGT